MKSYLSVLYKILSKVSFILVLIFSVYSLTFSSHAQARDLDCYNLAGKVVDIDRKEVKDKDLGRCIEKGPLNASIKDKAEALTTINTTNATTKKTIEEKAAAAASKVNPCNGVGTWYLLGTDRIPCEIWLYFTKFVLQIAAELTNLSGKLFDYTTKSFVLEISTLFKNKDGKDGEFIYGAWGVIRDIANITAFFGAVFTGFRYIIGSESLDFKKSVTKLILYSILVNFSFPISKFLIDISNVISLQIYGGISSYRVGENIISSNILSSMNLNSLISQVGSTNPEFKGFPSFSLMWLAIIYLLSVFFVFLYASIMIIVRTFIFLMCVILSPLMFLNFAFPKITELHEKWRENFFGQLMFGPVLMFGFWLSFILLQAASVTNSSNSYNDLGSLINMLLAIVSLFVTVKLAAAVSGGAGKAVSGFVGGAIKNAGLAVATGGTAMLGRQTIGRAGAALANSKWIKNTGSENGAVRRIAANLAGGAGTRMANLKVLGGKSFTEKVKGTVNEDRQTFTSENSEKIKKHGMTDLINQAKTPEELKKAKEELDKRANDTTYKGNDDLFGRVAEKKAFENNQSDRKEARLDNVSSKNRKEFFQEKDNVRRFESGEVTDLRAERLRKVIAGREKNLSKANELSLNPVSDDEMTKIKNKLDSSKEKSNLFAENRRLINSKDKVEALKNTSASAAFANNVGAVTGVISGNISDFVTQNPLSRVVGNYASGVKDRSVEMAGQIGQVIDSPSFTANALRNLADGYRSKRKAERQKKNQNQEENKKTEAQKMMDNASST